MLNPIRAALARRTITGGVAAVAKIGGGRRDARGRGFSAVGMLAPLRRDRNGRSPVVCMAPEEEKMTRQSPLDFSIEAGIMCEPCKGRGWLLCDFCEGKKTYVKAENNRIYRRCPTCKAVGYVICQKCKVFKCVTFPDYSDGEL
uniref:Uncharacterized protein n=1 Tax=Ananas comosus var. bracteatus TaxID=296719 RepID=A0A6V7P1N1_ANACO|nr:unnamed protein product [Ananas comosus var. bracteatus]